MRTGILPGAALGAFLALWLGSCAPRPHPSLPAPPTGRLRIAGSDTMLPLAQRLAEEFMTHTPGLSVEVIGGGTTVGARALIGGEADLCTASRTFTAAETRDLLRRRGALGICILCARDALSIYLNPGNQVEDLSLDQVRRLLTGRVTSWSEVGGRDLPVQVYVREPNSGTRGFLQEQVLLGEPFLPTARVCQGTKALVRAVVRDSAGIGFGGLAFGDSVRLCHIDGVPPTPDRVRDGSYPLARYLYLYSVDAPQGVARSFVDFVLSPAGQSIVATMGYIPLWDAR